MTTLYIFPHPDDESFGPAPVMFQQLQQGEKVHLLTLTKGESTKVRFKLNKNKKEMAEIREHEMKCVYDMLHLTSMTILDIPDGTLHEMDPLELETLVHEYIDKIKPNIVVTYPVHGISGHHDHLTIHAVVKRVFTELRKKPNYDFLKRLAFFTLPAPENAEQQGGNANVNRSRIEYIDCIVSLKDSAITMLKDCLNCYETFQEVIKETGVIDQIGDKVYFEFFSEDFKPEVSSLREGLS